MKNMIAALLCVMLFSGDLFSKVVKKEIPAYNESVFVYYQDGREVARETIDAEGNVRVKGKIPAEYYNKENPESGAVVNRPERGSYQGPSWEDRKRDAAGRGVKKTYGGKRRGFTPYEGEMLIRVNPNERLLGGMNRNVFSRYRIKKVKEYERLNIFPGNYDPLSPLQNEIYGRISFGAGWAERTEFYMCNPYLLVMLSKARYIIAFEEYCGLPSVSYRDGVIEEKYSGSYASLFFTLAVEANEKERELSQVVRIVTLNARDAGFQFYTVDKAKCENIDFSWNNTPSNISNSVHMSRDFCDYRDLINNIATDTEADVTLKIKEMYKYTRIYVKLWRQQPAENEEQEDLAYVITVENW